MSPPFRAVFDCNTFLQAMAAPEGPAGRCVQLAFDQAVALFISPAVIRELSDVAQRPRVAAQLRLTPQRLAVFIETIERTATVLQDPAGPFHYERDPDDALYVNLALAAGASLIVSRDRDLLDLMNDTNREGRQLRTDFPQLQILTPPQFLEVVTAG